MNFAQFPEVKYVSKNKLLQDQFNRAFNPTEEDQKTFERYFSLFYAIITNDWKEVDKEMKALCYHLDEYRNIFALLFKFHYQCRLIDKKQFQTALQIQQVRTHPLLLKTNAFYREKYEKQVKMGLDMKSSLWNSKRGSIPDYFITTTIDDIYDSVELLYYNELSPNVQNILLERLLKNWKKNCEFKYPINGQEMCRKHLQNHLKDSLWYKSLCFHNAYAIPYSEDVPFNQYFYFAIPETLNFSSFLYTYEPQLVAGTLKSSTFLQHIRQFKKRPFVLWHPDVKSSSLKPEAIDGFVPIFYHWMHDFHHMSVDFSNHYAVQEAQKAILQKKQHACLYIHDCGMLVHQKSEWQHHAS